MDMLPPHLLMLRQPRRLASEKESARENARRLHAAVERVLTEQEKEVVCMRYGLLGQLPKKQWEVADTLGISRSYVSRIEKRALGKLREVLGEKL